MQDFLAGAWHALGGYFVYLLLFVLSIVGLKWFAKNKQDVEYAKVALNLVKVMLGERLGPKAQAVIEVWIAGLESVKDGNLTTEEMVDQFMEFVKAAVAGKITLTEADLKTIREAVEATLQMLNLNSKPTEVAMKAMMVN